MSYCLTVYGRYTLHHCNEVLSAHFKMSFGAVAPRYNLAPTERIRFIFSNANEQRQVSFARWGLVPHWSKDGSMGKPLFNARGETRPSCKSLRFVMLSSVAAASSR